MEDLEEYIKNVLEEEELVEIKGDALGKIVPDREKRDKSWVYKKFFTLEPLEAMPETVEEVPEEEEDLLETFKEVPKPLEISVPEVEVPKREVSIAEKPRPPAHEEEISPRTKELLNNVEEVNRLYDITYVTYNLDKVKSKFLQFLSERNKLLDKNPYVVERIDKNLEEIKKRIASVERKKESDETRKGHEAFLGKLDRVLREYTKKYIAANAEEVRRMYLQLLDEKDSMGNKFPQLREVAENRIQTLRDRIDTVERGKDLKKEVLAIMKLSSEIMERAKRGDLEGLTSNYKTCVTRYEAVAKEIPKPVGDKVRKRLTECKRILQSLRNKKKVREKRKEETTARTSRYEVQGIKIYWNTYMKEIDDLKKQLSRAKSSHYFELYNRFNKLRDTYANLVKRNVIPEKELQKARIELSESFTTLESLKNEM
jgi:hypothetical protein